MLKEVGRSRAIIVVAKPEIAEVAKDKPSTDLQINFDYDSAVVAPHAVPTLLALGKVLSGSDFKGMIFMINGHTDGRGSDVYNLELSRRRAETIKQALIEQFHLPPDSLVAVGFGKTQLKNLADPNADENRRVQIVNACAK